MKMGPAETLETRVSSELGRENEEFIKVVSISPVGMLVWCYVVPSGGTWQSFQEEEKQELA